MYKCAAGLAHTAVISLEGELFTWGFNVTGQLGLGDKKTWWSPYWVEKDIVGNLLPQIINVACGYYTTYAIDVFGNLFSWGKGHIGHKGLTNEELPRKVEINTENRIFTEIFVNKDTAVAFAPIRIYSISPNCGPSTGGTLLSIIGTGLLNSDRLWVWF